MVASGKGSVKVVVGAYVLPMSRPGHTYVLSLGSGGSAALIGRVHHLAGQHGVQPVAPSDRLQRWQQKGALLQHANALNCAAAKASLCKRTGLKKRWCFMQADEQHPRAIV